MNDETAAQTTNSIAHCRDVSHEYTPNPKRSWLGLLSNGDASSVTALQNLTVSVEHGDVIGVGGPSGSGKSTLLHLLAGLLVPTAGTVELFDQDVGSLSEAERTRLRHRHIGLVFQRFHLVSSLSARENVALPLIQSGIPRADRHERAMTLLQKVGLADRATHTPGELSGGEQQRVAIARALVTDPALVLADEPTGELDTSTGQRILELLTDLTSERAVVIASHDDAVLDVVNRELHLRDGQLDE